MRVEEYLVPDRILLALTGVAGILITLLDFLNLIPDRDVATLAKILLVGLGILMLSVVAESIQRDRGMRRLEATLRGWVLQPMDMDADVPKAFERGAHAATGYIHEAVLSWAVMDNQDLRDNYRNHRDARVLAHKLSLQQVVVIHHAQHFEEILGMVARFETNSRYELRCYEPCEPRLPAISLWAFGGSDMYIGSFQLEHGAGADQMLHVLDSNLNDWLNEYWRALWVGGKVVKQGTQVRWDVLDKIAARLQLPDDRYAAMKSVAQAGAKHGRWVNAQLRATTLHG